MEFVVPISREDLLRRSGKDSYTVSRCLTVSELTSRIDDCQGLLAEAGPSGIIDCFDVFYSVLNRFSSVDVTVREHYLNACLEALVDLSKSLDDAITSGLSAIIKRQYRNTLKMLMYIVAQFVEMYENESTKAATLDMATKGRKQVKKKGSGRGNSKITWEEERERVVQGIVQVLEVDLCQFCDPPTPEMLDEFSNLVAGVCFKFLENPAIARDKDLRDALFHVLGIVAKKYSQALSVALKVVQMLPLFEHLVTPLVHAITLIANTFGVKSIVTDIVREIGEKDFQDLSLDTSGTRNYSSFLVELARALPSIVLPAVTHLLPHLSGESYTMRNGILGAIGEVVGGALTGDVLDEERRETRDALLGKLEDHLHDVNAFVRSRALQTWIQLCHAKAIPLPRQKRLVDLVIGRMRDKSSHVRKSAVQLLTAFLTDNPFSGTLDRDDLQNELCMEEGKLKSLVESRPQSPPGTAQPESTEGREPEGMEQDGAGMEQRPEEEEEMEQDVAESGKVREEGGGSNESSEHAALVAKQMVVVQYLRDALSFSEQMTSCVPIAAQLLGSKLVTDVLESLEFLAAAREFGLSGGQAGIRKALALVWSSESSIRDAVKNIYIRLYLSLNKDLSAPIRDAAIVRNLLALVDGASCGELASLEEMVVLLADNGHIPKSVVVMLWDTFSGRVPDTNALTVRHAMLLLSMVARADPQVVLMNLNLLVEKGLQQQDGQSPDLVLARNCCLALQRLATPKSKRSSEQPFRLPASHPAFASLSRLISEQVGNLSSSQWCPFAEQAINTVYKLSENPDELFTTVLKKLCLETLGSGEETGSDGGTSLPLARLLFATGHVAQQQLVHLEVSIATELKRRRAVREEKEVEARRTPARRRSRRLSRKGAEDNIEEDMGLTGATADDSEAELMRRVCEGELCISGLLASLLPVIVTVVTNPSRYRSLEVQSAAALALAKYMLTSSVLCEQYLQLLFTVLERSSEPVIRSNTIIALGDLTFRYPNQVEPWSSHLYSRLRDPAPVVREHTLVVLTHLILNDMVKVKGQISELALCLQDPQPSLCDRAKLFFLELSKKGNALYNVLPDMISRLSDPTQNVSPDAFQSIMRYLFTFIQKDRQCESLIDKLCHRFRAARTERQWRDLAFCLSQVNFSERCLRRLQENYPCYHPSLTDPEVFSSFTVLLAKSKKFAKPEAKLMAEELEGRISAAHRKGLEETMEGCSGSQDTAETGQNENVPEGDEANCNKELSTPLASSRRLRPRDHTHTHQRTRRDPLQEANMTVEKTPLAEKSDFFNLSAISSARRSGPRSLGLTSEHEDTMATPSVRRKAGRGRRRRKGTGRRAAQFLSDKED